MRIAIIFIFFLLPLIATAADNDYEFSEDEKLTDSITVLAVSSVTIPISELALIYSQRNNFDVNAVFESSAELVHQLDDGEPADIIIFSNEDWMRNIKSRGLIEPKSIIKIAKNKLVLAASNKVTIPQNLLLPEALDYINSRMLIVMANPQDTTLGQATKTTLEKTNRWGKFEKMLVLAPNSARTTDLIIKSQTAGIIYYTDYLINDKSLNLVSDVPSDLHNPIIYQGAVVIGNNMNEARKFLQFLNSEVAKKIFKKYGFIVN